MKNPLLYLGLAAALALPTLGSATTLNTMTWNFLNDVPTHSAGVSVGSTHSFTDIANDTTTITATVDPSRNGYSLFEKKEGGDENGLGVSPESDDEITVNKPGILLNLSQVLALNPSTLSISFGSLTGSEVAEITYIDGDHDGDTTSFTVNKEGAVALNVGELKEEGGSILVTAASGNVLIGSITATPTPEPAMAGLMGLGLLAAGVIGRKRFQKQS